MLRRLMTAPQKDVAFTQVIRQPSPTNPNQKKTRVDVQLVRSEGCNHILCRSEQRIEKDKAIREKQGRWHAEDQRASACRQYRSGRGGFFADMRRMPWRGWPGATRPNRRGISVSSALGSRQLQQWRRCDAQH